MITIQDAFKEHETPKFVEVKPYGIFDITEQNCGEDYVRAAIEEAFNISDSPTVDLAICWNIYIVDFNQL